MLVKFENHAFDEGYTYQQRRNALGDMRYPHVLRMSCRSVRRTWTTFFLHVHYLSHYEPPLL